MEDAYSTDLCSKASHYPLSSLFWLDIIVQFLFFPSLDARMVGVQQPSIYSDLVRMRCPITIG